ncbi:MAG: hypothetical protein ACREMY_22680, partial [bacterium]
MSSPMPPLIDLLGFLTGAALYGLLFSVAARRAAPAFQQVPQRHSPAGNPAPQGGTDRLPLLTAILGLLW